MAIRDARPRDAEAIFEMIRELAAYEKLGDQVSGDAGVLRRELFEARTAEALIAERALAKRNRDFARSDQIRQQLLDAGIILEDTKEGARWKRK